MILKRSRRINKYALITEPNDTLDYTLRTSVGEEAKQHLREISQIYYLNNDYVKDLDWSSTKQENFPKNLETIKTIKGCFQINLKYFQTKTLNANKIRSIKTINEEREKPKSEISQQKPRFRRNRQERRLKDIVASRKYTIGDGNQSRIHSIKQPNVNSNNSYFIIDENAFKTAAFKLHNHFKSMQSPKTLEKRSQTRIQSQLVVRKKRIQKITSNPQPSQQKSVRYILVSPKKQINYSIPLANSMLHIQRRRISTAAKSSSMMIQKSSPALV